MSEHGGIAYSVQDAEQLSLVRISDNYDLASRIDL